MSISKPTETSQTTRQALADPAKLHLLTTEQKRDLLVGLLQRKIQDDSTYPMSCGQQGLWYAFRRDPASTPFNVFLPSRIRTRLDLSALRKAMEFLAQRHACLRTTFSDRDGELVQHVHRCLPPDFRTVDAQGWSDQQLQQAILEEAKRPFNLETGSLLRILVYEVAHDDFVVLAATHHIVVDFWSLVLLLSEFGEVYRCIVDGVTPTLPPPGAEYLDFVRQQLGLEETPLGQRCREYWKAQLHEVPTVLELPTDFVRPKQFLGTADVVPLAIPSQLAQAVTDFAAQQETTPFAVVMAALQEFISRYAGQKDFVIGCPFSGRSQARYESTFGFFVNMLPIRATLTDRPSFAQLARRVGSTLMGALEHQDYPFASIVRDLSPTRDPSRSPVFQVSCTFEKSHLREEAGRAGFLFPSANVVRDVGGIRQESFYIPQRTCHYDLEFIFDQADNSIHGMICFCNQLFAKETVSTMAENFVGLMERLLAEPSISTDACPWKLPKVTRVDKQVSLDSSSRSQSSVIADFWERCRTSPDAMAMTIDAESWSYRQTANLVRQIAESLASREISREDMVPVIGRKGPLTTGGMLGVLSSGAAFVPIDVDQPTSAVNALLKEINPRLIVVETAQKASLVQADGTIQRDVLCLEELWRHGNLRQPDSTDLSSTQDDLMGDIVRKRVQSVREEDLAYVIFTSGSTGRPKGVMVEHRAIANTMHWRKSVLPLTSADRVLMLFSHQFDAGMGICLATLLSGAELVWADNRSAIDLDQLIWQITNDRITVFPATPSLLLALLQHSHFARCESLRQIYSGGEAMPPELPSRLSAILKAQLWNLYGPTEAAVEATALRITSHDSRRTVSIGPPITNMTAEPVDEHLRRVPDTVPGELALCGAGLARGYLHQPEETSLHFRTSPETGQRLYLTGDRVRRLPGGDLEFLGRLDHQVKVRGYRLELGEIEQHFMEHPAVREIGLFVDEESASANLLGFVVGADMSAHNPLCNELLEWARQRMPIYKIPSSIFPCERLPRTASGKLDRRALAKLPRSDRGTDEQPQYRTPLEMELSRRWAEQLGWDQADAQSIGLHQNFFELGGNSLQAAILTAKLSEQLGVSVPTALLFDLATISQLARRLAELHTKQIATAFGSQSVTKYKIPRDGQPIQQRESHSQYSLLSPLRGEGSLPPIFLVHPPGGIVLCYRELATHLNPDRPLFGIRSHGLHGTEEMPETVEQMARQYLRAIRQQKPRGPYLLGGWSLGGIIAYEMAQQLQAQGETVDAVLLLDTSIPERATELVPAEDRVDVGKEYGIDLTLEQLSRLDASDQLPFLWQHAKNLGVIHDETPSEVVQQVLEQLKILFHHHVQLVNAYRMQPYTGRIVLFRPREVPFQQQGAADRGWSNLASGVKVVTVPGHHHSMVQSPHVLELASEIERWIGESSEA